MGLEKSENLVVTALVFAVLTACSGRCGRTAAPALDAGTRTASVAAGDAGVQSDGGGTTETIARPECAPLTPVPDKRALLGALDVPKGSLKPEDLTVFAAELNGEPGAEFVVTAELRRPRFDAPASTLWVMASSEDGGVSVLAAQEWQLRDADPEEYDATPGFGVVEPVEALEPCHHWVLVEHTDKQTGADPRGFWTTRELWALRGSELEEIFSITTRWMTISGPERDVVSSGGQVLTIAPRNTTPTSSTPKTRELVVTSEGCRTVFSFDGTRFVEQDDGAPGCPLQP